MASYDDIRFDPPAPLAYVTLRNSLAKTSASDVPMLLDSGADVTMIPREIMNQLKLAVDPSKSYEIESFNGTTSISEVVQLELDFCGRTYRGQFLLVDQLWGIIGRNILNTVSLVHDGPRLQWAEHRI